MYLKYQKCFQIHVFRINCNTADNSMQIGYNSLIILPVSARGNGSVVGMARDPFVYLLNMAFTYKYENGI